MKSKTLNIKASRVGTYNIKVKLAEPYVSNSLNFELSVSNSLSGDIINSISFVLNSDKTAITTVYPSSTSLSLGGHAKVTDVYIMSKVYPYRIDGIDNKYFFSAGDASFTWDKNAVDPTIQITPKYATVPTYSTNPTYEQMPWAAGTRVVEGTITVVWNECNKAGTVLSTQDQYYTLTYSVQVIK